METLRLSRACLPVFLSCGVRFARRLNSAISNFVLDCFLIVSLLSFRLRSPLAAFRAHHMITSPVPKLDKFVKLFKYFALTRLDEEDLMVHYMPSSATMALKQNNS